jgi:exodeoxyribonuclease-3
MASIVPVFLNGYHTAAAHGMPYNRKCVATGGTSFMRIASWNVNSVRQRLEHLLSWLKECAPDIVCLQEIKCLDEAFPREAVEALGYNVVTHGQKTFNGVALLSKLPFDETKSGLAGDDDDTHARFLEGVVTLKTGVLRVACLYLPNGNPPQTEKFTYKLKWMSRLLEYSAQRLKGEEPMVLAGDFNVIPNPQDVHNPAAWVNDALFRPQTRESFQSLLGLGLTDALRAATDAPAQYTFWDYQAGAWQKNHGLRIDHLLLSPQASDLLIGVGIDSYVRGWEKPSDHVPVWADLDLATA